MDRVLEIPQILQDAGCEKITLTGGEPFLYTGLFEILSASKEAGLTTCVVTNGSLLTREKLLSLGFRLDWIGLSLDSGYESVEKELGRGKGSHISQIRKVASWAHDLGIRLKMNTVVTSLTSSEDMTDIIRQLRPARWKAFQVIFH
jgi:radical S-adenosyl methionine domain-containing protein 2